MIYVEENYKDKFDLSFQKKILHLILKDVNFLSNYSSTIKPQYFEISTAVDISRIILEFYEKYNVTPTFPSLMNELTQFFEKTKKAPKQRGEYIDLLTEISTLDFQDYDYVKENILSFAKQQAVKGAIVEATKKHLKSENYPQIYKELSDAMAVGDSFDSLGLFLHDKEHIKQRINYYKNIAEFKFSTGFPLLDLFLKGGFTQGELVIFLGGTNVGKSQLMVQIGSNLVRGHFLKPKNVTHLVFEMAHEERTMQRYDACITGKNMNLFWKYPKQLKKILTGALQKIKNKLVVKYIPGKKITPLGVKNFIHQLKVRKNFQTDILILDYADLMSPEVVFKEKRHNISAVYEDLLSLGGELNIPILTPTQSTRAAWDKPILQLADAAEDADKIRLADVVISLNQTTQEYAMTPKQLRLIVLKNREGFKYGVIPYDVFYENCRFQEKKIAPENLNDLTDLVIKKGKEKK